MIKHLYRKLRNLDELEYLRDELEYLRKENALLLNIKDHAHRYMHIYYNPFPKDCDELKLNHDRALEKEAVFNKLYHNLFQYNVIKEQRSLQSKVRGHTDEREES